MAGVLVGTTAGAQGTGRVGAAAGVRRPRIVAIDAARAVAIIGMLVVNSGPQGLDGAASHLWVAAHGRASLLFVLLAGLGVALMARRRSPSPTTARTLLWRAALLLALGVALTGLDHGAQVILPTYAALFCLALGAVRLPTRWLVVVGAASATLGPLVFLLAQQSDPAPYDREDLSLGASPAEALEQLVVTGAYPLVTWVAPFVVGLLLGRLPLRSPAVQLRLLWIGAGTAAVAVGLSQVLVTLLGEPGDEPGPDHLVLTTGHSQMPLWLIGGTGAAVAILGLLMRVEQRLGAVLRPLVVTGQLALTIYVAHLVVLHLLPDRPPLVLAGVQVPFALLLPLAAVALAWLWRMALPLGPLEAVMRLPSSWSTWKLKT